MCQINAGQLIVCFPKFDPASRNVLNQIRENKIEHVSLIESMEQRLGRFRLRPNPDIVFDFHLIAVPAGSENWKATWLQWFYKHAMLEVLTKEPARAKDLLQALSRSDYQFTVAPNYQMSMARAAGPAVPVSVKDFKFGPYHKQFRSEIGLLIAPEQPQPVRVLVIDSGIAPDAATAKIRIRSQHNMLDSKNPQSAPDDVGHGTAIAMVIADLAPHAEFTFIKVADATQRVSEWDALAALVAKTDADVVNLSLQFGLADLKKCDTCGRGRESQASRSAVFENIVDQRGNSSPQSFLVAAAGNSGLPELSYPARFSNVLAIGSINSKRRLSSFSNYGNQDHVGSPHTNHFVLPGGETDPAHKEDVLISAGGQSWSGTSLATAFATGLIAHKLGHAGCQKSTLLSILKQRADRTLTNYSPNSHGNGLMRN